MDELQRAPDAATGSAARDDDFREFFYEHFRPLASYIAALTSDQAAAEDVAQEALVRTWARWTRVREPGPYSYLVATNIVRKEATRERRRAQLPRRPSVPPQVAAPDITLRDLVDRLPKRVRLPVLLHYYADLPIADIARLMHIPQGSVRQRLHEGRRLLALAYQDLP